MFETNCCDGIYNSLDVHFTSACDNKCKHCIDQEYSGLGIKKPNVQKICETIIRESKKVDDVLFLGGEPCLYLKELVECVKILRKKTTLKLYVTSAMPKKIRINLNIVKPFLFKKDDIVSCLKHYDAMGFNSIKVSEIQHGVKHFVSFEELFDLKMKSAYTHGCQTYLDMDRIIKGFKTPLLLKRSCFMCEETLKATLLDGIKAICKVFKPSKNNYGVVYEDGTLTKGWV